MATCADIYLLLLHTIQLNMVLASAAIARHSSDTVLFALLHLSWQRHIKRSRWATKLEEVVLDLMMALEKENFHLSGPLHLTVIDWKNAHHRRSIAASLVQGAYIVERDRQQNREGPNALAPPWWEFFNFQLVHVLVDPEDSSIFGCVYCNYSSNHTNNNYNQHSPKYVITFRGTIIKPHTRSQDLKLDLQCIRNRLHRSSRYQLGLKAVRDIIAKAGSGNNSNDNKIWLAGHSLGSAIALLIGRNLVRRMEFYHIDQTYLFNPPFISTLPLEKIIKNEKLKQGMRVANSFITAGLAAAVKRVRRRKPEQQLGDDPFTALSGWIPYLFVNPSDPICSEYIGYFEHREKMMAIGSGKLGKLAAQNSILSTILSASRRNDSDSASDYDYDCEPFHLVPNAYLTTNLSPSQRFKQAHGIHQWWKSDVQLEYKLHEFKLKI